MRDNEVEHTAEIRAVCRVPEDKTTENHGDYRVLPCTTVGEVRGGPNAARRQVAQIAAGIARVRRKRLSFPGFSAARDIRNAALDSRKTRQAVRVPAPARPRPHHNHRHRQPGNRAPRSRRLRQLPRPVQALTHDGQPPPGTTAGSPVTGVQPAGLVYRGRWMRAGACRHTSQAAAPSGIGGK
jgi:hypothetical protein